MYTDYQGWNPRNSFSGISFAAVEGLRLNYKFTMTNDDHNLWFKHFSVDEFLKLMSKHLFHATYKIFLVSITYKLMSLFMLSIAYGQYAIDGVGHPSIKTLGLIFSAASEYLFLLLSILIAKGYTITRGRLRPASAIKLAIFMFLYFINYAAIFIYQKLYFDPGKVLYLYESPAGYAIIALRLAAFFWFLAGPVMILIATIYIPKWTRAKVMNAVEHALAILAHAGFLLLTRPSVANKRFPYHVKTSQIDVMKNSVNGTVGDNSIDNFNHQPYPSTDPAHRYHVPNYDDLFIVQRSMEMMNVNNGHGPVNLQNHSRDTAGERSQMNGNVCHDSAMRNENNHSNDLQNYRVGIHRDRSDPNQTDEHDDGIDDDDDDDGDDDGDVDDDDDDDDDD
ncbi:Transmembrane protein 145 [Nymphon striatum]|nr:Transmembrane protein 145 [Nymphon striatum]